METPTRDWQPIRSNQAAARGAEGGIHARVSEDIRRELEGSGARRTGHRPDLSMPSRWHAARDERDLPVGDHHYSEHDLHAHRISDHAAADLFRRTQFPR